MITTLIALGLFDGGGDPGPPSGLTVRADRIVDSELVRTWVKYPGERVLVGRDWTDKLDGATIAQHLAPVLPTGSTIDLDFIELQENLSVYWLSAGAARNMRTVRLSILTSEGETLSDHPLVIVRR